MIFIRSQMSFIKYLLFFSLIYIWAGTAEAGLTKEDVATYVFQCSESNIFNISLVFAPVKILPEESVNEDEWSYRFVNKEKKYPDDKINIPSNRAIRVDLVSTLYKKDVKQEESFLWHVIVAPRVTGWGFGGHWPTKENNLHSYRGVKKENLLMMKTLSSIESGEPVHTKIDAGNIDSAETLNKVWMDVFGQKIIKNLVFPSTRGAIARKSGYSITFYHVPIPSLRLINDEGYKWVSSKHIDKPGKIFGFVLSPEGDCINWTAVDAVNE